MNLEEEIDSAFESIGGWEVEVGSENGGTVDRQEIIGMLLSIITPEKDDIATTRQTTFCINPRRPWMPFWNFWPNTT
jgi:hypothetical protein